MEKDNPAATRPPAGWWHFCPPGQQGRAQPQSAPHAKIKKETAPPTEIYPPLGHLQGGGIFARRGSRGERKPQALHTPKSKEGSPAHRNPSATRPPAGWWHFCSPGQQGSPQTPSAPYTKIKREQPHPPDPAAPLPQNASHPKSKTNCPPPLKPTPAAAKNRRFAVVKKLTSRQKPAIIAPSLL